jgi:hypothetical protein
MQSISQTRNVPVGLAAPNCHLETVIDWANLSSTHKITTRLYLACTVVVEVLS